MRTLLFILAFLPYFVNAQYGVTLTDGSVITSKKCFQNDSTGVVVEIEKKMWFISAEKIQAYSGDLSKGTQFKITPGDLLISAGKHHNAAIITSLLSAATITTLALVAPKTPKIVPYALGALGAAFTIGFTISGNSEIRESGKLLNTKNYKN